MAVIGSYVQQPADRMDYDVDCTDLVDDDADSIASAVVTVTPATGLTVNSVVNPAHTGVKVWAGPGAVGTYKAEVTVTTTLGRIKQDELKIRVKEV